MNFFGRRKGRFQLNTKCLRGKCLELFAKDDRVGPARLHEFHLLRRKGAVQFNELFVAICVVEFFLFGVDGQYGAGRHRVFLFKDRVAIIVEDRVAVFVNFLDPVFQVDPDTAGHANCGQEDRGNTVGARHNRRVIHEWHVRRSLFTRPERHVVHAGHPRRTHAHGALFGNEHDLFARVLEFKRLDLFLCRWRDHAFAVQFAVRTGVRFGARGQKVRGNIAFARNICHDLNFFVDLRQLGEELSFRIAFQEVLGHSVARFVRFCDSVSISLVEENLRLKDFGGLCRERCVIAKRDVEQNPNGRATLHVGQELKSELF